MELTPPKTIREVQRLTGMVAALGRFVSKSAQRCLPFFNAVKGIKTAPWTRECQVAFEELKQYLSSPSLLTKPELGEELLLYLSVSPMALAAVLIREEHNQQKPIYYVSKVLHDAETRYQRIEKLAYALVMAARKLRPYFQAHTIKVWTDHHSDRPAIKAKVLADFVAECTIPQQSIAFETVETPVVEEITTPRGQVEAEVATLVRKETGLILTGPENFILDYALRFGFCASNNEEEYEALITGMNLAVQTRAQRLKAYCDSQLVANQIQGVYEAHDERMIKYLAKVRLLDSKFKSFEFIRIPRTKNTKADVLSKLAASGYTALGSICMEFLKKSSVDNEVDHSHAGWTKSLITYVVGNFLKERKRHAK
ncbi:uncharacterized protein LOC143869813 [Tasmannia lanceolata]|uniref:uncharacterized protein LOC143869813 n=1 Tax=Tasmannia lanceolata TaxID=3420 RepID=UPI004062D309